MGYESKYTLRNKIIDGESDKVRKGTAKLLFMFCFLAFSLMTGSFAAVAEAAPTVSLQLQVEEPVGSGIWKDTGVIRQTGQRVKYRLYYSISDPSGATIENASAKIVFPGSNQNVSSLDGIVLPSAVNSVTMGGTTTDPSIDVKFKSPTPSGTTGTLEFRLYIPGIGPNGLVMTPTLSFSGTSVASDNIKTPFTIDGGTGPSLTISGTLPTWKMTKTVSMEYYSSDEDAYLFDYTIRGAKQSVAGDLQGVESWKMIDQLPDIPGLTPVVVSTGAAASGVTVTYDPVTKRITYSGFSPYSASENKVITIKYPKAQVDALGGPDLAITNKTYVEVIYTGNIPYVSPEASVTHHVNPAVNPIRGKMYSSKSAWSSNGNTELRYIGISGLALESAALPYLYSVSTSLSNTSASTPANLPPKQIEVIDNGLVFTRPDNTTYSPGADEAYFTSLEGSTIASRAGGTWQFYYRTSPTGAWIAVGSPNYAGVLTLPAGAVGWRVVVDSPTVLLPQVLVSARAMITQRSEDSPIQYVDNTTSNYATYPDGNVINSNALNRLPVAYDRKIVSSWGGMNLTYGRVTPVAGGTLAPGRDALVEFNAEILSSSTVSTKGTFFAILLPPELIYTGISNTTTHTPTVIENYLGTGQTLVRLDGNKTTRADVSSSLYNTIKVTISPTADLKTYQIPMYFGINSEQANNSQIAHSATGRRLQDIYDFDRDGDITELIAGENVSFLLSATGSANIAKMVKGPRDQIWKTSGSKVEGNEEFQYRFFFRNDSDGPMTNLVIIDTLPKSGDQDPLTGTSRNSLWQPILTGPITAPAGATVYYSTSSTPDMTPIVANGWSGSWSTAVPGDLSTVTAIKIDFGSRQFAPGESAEAIVSMKVPAQVATNYSVARNTLNFAISEVLPNQTLRPLLPAGSSPAEIIYRLPNSTISDYVWTDGNSNGIQDASEIGMNDITVELYSDVDNYTTPIKTTVTIDSPTSKPGYYLFGGLREGNYKVKFPIGSASQLTLQQQGSDRSKDSDPNSATGWTDVIVLTDNEDILTIDAGYLPYTAPVTKVADNNQKVVLPGENVSYTITLTANKGYATYSMTDVMVGRNSNFTWVSGTVSVNGGSTTSVSPAFGDTMTFAGAGALTQNDVVVFKYTLKAKDTIRVGSYSNIATATLAGESHVAPPVVVHVPILKSANKSNLFKGEQVEYTIEFKNVTGQALSSWSIDDVMSGRGTNFDVIEVAMNGMAQMTPVSADTLTFTGGSLDVGESAFLTYILEAKTTSTEGTYTNTATVTLSGTPYQAPPVDVAIGEVIKITGTVFDDTNANGIWESATDIAFNGYAVKLKNNLNTVVATATTDSNGFYSFTIPTNGVYTVEVDMTAKLAASWTETTPDTANVSSVSTRTVTVTGSTVANQNFGYNLKGQIIGYTLWDSDLTGVYIPDDMNYPIIASTVNLVNTVTGLTEQTELTDSAGKFVFAGLDPAKQYKVIVDHSSPSLSSLTPIYLYDSMTSSALSVAAEVVAPISAAQPNIGPYIFGFRAATGDLVITKKAGVGTARVGDLVPYTITIENTNTSSPADHIIIQDLIPAGFKFVSGSARLDKAKISDPTGTRPVYFEIGTVGPSQKLTLSYFLIVGAGAQPGEYKNIAVAKDANNDPKSNEATATVTVIADPLFDDSLVFGKVFVDKNGDGQQDADEPGIGGVKLVTVRGEIITTDKQGRYHIPAVSGGRSDIGTNFTLKLDVRSLPAGAKVLTDNPRTVRNTPGLPSRINFAVSLPTEMLQPTGENEEQ